MRQGSTDKMPRGTRPPTSSGVSLLFYFQGSIVLLNPCTKQSGRRLPTYCPVTRLSERHRETGQPDTPTPCKFPYKVAWFEPRQHDPASRTRL